MANITITFETPSVEGADALSPIKILMYGMPGSGITAGAKRSLISLLEKVAYIDEDGQTYLDALEAELFPPASLESITAVYSGGSVMAGANLDSLKSNLTVTAHYDDASSEEVTTYTLSGTIANNPSTITVSYSGKVTTFTVPVATLSSITAVYTQSGAVYDTDALEDLRSDLVVTAHYSDGTSGVVTTYTLSGTLTVGTSTITVSYGGQVDTFSVTVTSAPITYLYNWDLTQSLVDSVASQEITLGCANWATNATQDSNGLTFDNATQYAYLGQIEMPGKTIEIDVASFVFAGDTSYHIRFLSNSQYTTSTSKGLGAIVWRKGLGWTSYGWSAETGTELAWSASYWSNDLTGSTSEVINAFSGKTVKVVYHSDGHTKDLYLNNEKVGTISDVYFNNGGGSHFSDKMYIAGMASVNKSNGDQCYNMTITGVRIYANNE